MITRCQRLFFLCSLGNNHFPAKRHASALRPARILPTVPSTWPGHDTRSLSGLIPVDRRWAGSQLAVWSAVWPALWPGLAWPGVRPRQAAHAARVSWPSPRHASADAAAGGHPSSPDRTRERPALASGEICLACPGLPGRQRPPGSPSCAKTFIGPVARGLALPSFPQPIRRPPSSPARRCRKTLPRWKTMTPVGRADISGMTTSAPPSRAAPRPWSARTCATGARWRRRGT